MKRVMKNTSLTTKGKIVKKESRGTTKKLRRKKKTSKTVKRKGMK